MSSCIILMVWSFVSGTVHQTTWRGSLFLSFFLYFPNSSRPLAVSVLFSPPLTSNSLSVLLGPWRPRVSPRPPSKSLDVARGQGGGCGGADPLASPPPRGGARSGRAAPHPARRDRRPAHFYFRCPPRTGRVASASSRVGAARQRLGQLPGWTPGRCHVFCGQYGCWGL